MRKEQEEADKVIQRLAKDECSLNDSELIRKWIADPGADRILRRAFERFWYHDLEESHPEDEKIELSSCLDKIHHKINQVNRKMPVLREYKTGRAIIHRALTIFSRIAAVIVVPLIILNLSHFFRGEDYSLKSDAANVYSEVYAPLGSRIKIDLPDGSVAWLNHGTVLKYPQVFDKHSRELYLSGEAYFDVVGNKARPFIIKTPVIDVRVTGTSFNVMAYKEDDNVEVTLEQGKLDIYRNFQDKSCKKILTLVPGEHVAYDLRSKKISRTGGDTDKYTAWKEGNLILLDDPMDLIVRKLERWYNVEIELVDRELADYTFTATFTDETFTQVLKLLSLAAPLEYTITPRVMQADHTFTKSIVTLKLKGIKNNDKPVT